MVKKNLILAILISLILGLVLGYFLGVRQLRQTIPQKLKETLEPQEMIKTLSALKMISNWSAVASGEVSKISDRKLTLISNSETLEIPINKRAKIITSLDQKEIEFKDIKVGDRVSVSLSIRDNELDGNFVYLIGSPK